MILTFDREARRVQKEFLKSIYPDYTAQRHDAFVIRYNIDTDKAKTAQYMQNRGV